MKFVKRLVFFIIGAFLVYSASGQANASINILTLNGGQVTLGQTVDIQVTVGNTGPVSSIGVNKVRAQISIPSAIATALPNPQQTGLPSGWIILSNTGGTIQVCNGTDIIPVGQQRQIFIKVQANAVGGPSTVSGVLSFGPGTGVCTGLGTLPGNITADDISQSTIQVVPALPCTIALTASAGTIQCNGGTTTLTATATGANGSVEYSLNGGAFQSGNTFTVNAAGSPYTVVARELTNPSCTATATPVTITEPPVVPAPTVNVVQPTCTIANGTITVTSSTAGLTFSLDGGVYAAYPSGGYNVATGIHTLAAQNINGCISAVTNITVNAQPPVPAMPTVNVVQPTCTVVNGTITVTSSTTGLTFSLDGGVYASYPAGGYIVPGGTHTLTAQDAGGCISTAASIIVNAQPTTPTAPVVGAIIQPTCTVSTGSVVLNGLPSGNWTINPGAIAGNTTSATINGLAPGTYNFTVTNSVGCISPASADIVINIVLGTPLAPIVSIVQPNCTVANGIITVTSPTTGLTFSFDGGAYTVYPAGGYIAAPGSHTLTAQNASGCFSPVTNITVDAQPPTPAAPDINVTQPTCTVATGIITVTSSTTGLTFSFDGGPYTAYPAGGYITAPGTHTLTAQNSNGCISPVVTIIIDAQPPIPSAPIIGSITQPTCIILTGSVELNGLPPGNWTLIRNPGGITTTGNTATTTISGLATGTYNFTVTNSNGCISSSSADVIIMPVAGTPTAPAVNVVQPTCTVATGTITVTSSTTGLIFSLDGGPYTVYPPSGYIVLPGAHTITAQNAASCTSPVTNVIVDVQPPTPAAPTVNVFQPTCTVATGTINITSSTTGLIFSLDGGVYAIYPPGGYITGTGSHTLTAQNVSGCISAITNVVVNLPPVPPTVSASAGTISCFGGTTTLTVDVLGGSAPFEYSLNGGAAFQPGNTFTVTAGSYTVIVRDANLCTATTNTVIVTQPTVITASVSNGIIVCNAGTTTLVISTAGGTAPYEYRLNGGAYQGNNSFIVGAGAYTITVRDANLCTATSSITVTQPGVFSASSTARRITQCGGTTEVIVAVSGGTAPYTGTGTFTRGPGTFIFPVTDARGCTTNTEITIEAPGCMNLRVYPNPAGNSLNINHSIAEPGAVMQVFSTNGALVLSKSVSQNTFLTTIDISRLAAGIYIAVFINGSDKKSIFFEKGVSE